VRDFIFLLISALASLLPFELLGAARQVFGVFGGHEVHLSCSKSCLAVLLRISLFALLHMDLLTSGRVPNLYSIPHLVLPLQLLSLSDSLFVTVAVDY
jgi:hypothetical protein